MSLPWIQINNKLLEGVKVINSVDLEPFSSLLDHIVNLKSNETISSSELQKYEKSLALSIDNLTLMIKSVRYITQKLMQIIVKPGVLLKQLMGPLQLSEEKAKEFLRIWIEDTRNNFNNLENKNELSNVTWELDLEVASDKSVSQTSASSKLQLSLKNTAESKVEDRILICNENDILKLFNTLENIQNKLDTIRTSS